VLEATAGLLQQAPYADLNIERIARRAGISRTAFYFYFHDKREVLMRLAADVAERLYAEADTWFSAEDDPAAQLRESMRRLAALYAEHGAVLRAVAEGATSDEQIATFWNGMIQRLIDGSTARIEAEVRGGRATLADAEATAFALCWMTERAFHQQFVQGEPLTKDALVDALCEIWVRAVYGSGPAWDAGSS
jgi:AcrR family transcriptional regulator